MSSVKPFHNLAIVGAGRQGLAILEALVPLRNKDQPLRAVGVEKGRQLKPTDLPFVVGAEEEVAGLSLEDVERRYIAQVLASAKGHISNAAKVLRIYRTTLYHKIKKYGLAP
ncbi:MAG: helix-turn-helix domain-containing protein [Desulfobaccales bacterium]